jgi:hypothetical protein
MAVEKISGLFERHRLECLRLISQKLIIFMFMVDYIQGKVKIADMIGAFGRGWLTVNVKTVHTILVPYFLPGMVVQVEFRGYMGDEVVLMDHAKIIVKLPVYIVRVVHVAHTRLSEGVGLQRNLRVALLEISRS